MNIFSDTQLSYPALSLLESSQSAKLTRLSWKKRKVKRQKKKVEAKKKPEYQNIIRFRKLSPDAKNYPRLDLLLSCKSNKNPVVYPVYYQSFRKTINQKLWRKSSNKKNFF